MSKSVAQGKAQCPAVGRDSLFPRAGPGQAQLGREMGCVFHSAQLPLPQSWAMPTSQCHQTWCSSGDTMMGGGSVLPSVLSELFKCGQVTCHLIGPPTSPWEVPPSAHPCKDERRGLRGCQPPRPCSVDRQVQDLLSRAPRPEPVIAGGQRPSQSEFQICSVWRF